jgi:hypothetical protein
MFLTMIVLTQNQLKKYQTTTVHDSTTSLLLSVNHDEKKRFFIIMTKNFFWNFSYVIKYKLSVKQHRYCIISSIFSFSRKLLQR